MDLTAFLDRLDELDDQAREELYGEHQIDLSLEATRQAVIDRRPCAGWLILRRLAGPPGTVAPLPDEECIQRLSEGAATMLDAYGILFRGGPYAPEADVHVLLQLCTSAAWRDAGGNYLSMWIAVWSALAGFAAGDPEPMRLWGRLGEEAPEAPPGFENVSPILRLLEAPGLGDSILARRAVAGHWSGPPAIPELPVPAVDGGEMKRGEWLGAVEELGDEELLDWAQEGLRRSDVRVAARIDEHPTITAIRQAALTDEQLDPEDHGLPNEFESWLLVAVGRGEHRAARVGALLAWRHQAIPVGLLLPPVLSDLRREDLALLVEVAPPEFGEALREVQAALPHLPREAGDDLVIVASALHPDLHMAAARLTTQLELIENLPVQAGGWLSHTIDWLRGLRAQPEQASAAAAQLDTSVATILGRLPPFEDLTSDQLLAAIRDFPPVPLEPMALVGLDEPVGRLVGALLLRRAAQGLEAPEALGISAMLADTAARAIMDLADARFFELRVELLEEVLAAAPTATEAVRAKISLANTISGMSASSTDGLRRATELFAEAMKDAGRLGDPDLVANTVAMWALSLRAHALFQDSDGTLRRAALHRIDQALTLQIDPDFRSKLLHVKATVLGHPAAGEDRASPMATAALLEEAVSLAPLDRWRFDLQRELADHWLQAGQLARAEQCLRECLDKGRPYLDPADIGLLHADLGRLIAQRAPTEAEPHLREALRLTSSTSFWGYCAVRLAECLVQQRRPEEALDLLRRVADAVDTLPTTHRWELWRWKMVVEWQVGERSVAAEARDQALALVKGTVDEAIVQLLWAELAPSSGASLEIAVGYVRGDGGPSSAEADNVVSKLLTHQMAAIDDELRLELLAWSRERRQPHLESLLLEEGGDRDAALYRLDAALDGAGEDKLGLRLLRLAMLPYDPPDALRAELDRIRALVTSLEELSFSGLCDYAQACRLGAHGDLSWLDRSLHAWELVASTADASRDYLPHVAMGTTYAVRNRVQAANLHSDPELGPYVARLLPLVPHLGDEHVRGLHELLGLLLLPGPLMHPDLRPITRDLLRAAPAHPWVTEFTARLNSITASDEQPGVNIWALPQGLQAKTPFDDQPHPWLVAAVAGRPVGPPPASVMADLEGLFLCCRIRPDRADALLAAVACAVDEFGTGKVEAFAALAVLVIQEAPLGPGVWPELLAAASDHIEPSPSRDRLLHHLRRARFDLDQEVGATQPDRDETWEPQRRFDEAVRHIDLSKLAGGDEAELHKRLALEKLGALVGDHPELNGAGYRISLGNAHRLHPSPDLDAAIACYEHVVRWGTDIGTGGLGRLHKVWADALRERGHDGDHDAAWDHIQEALRHRKDGRLRTETLLTAAQIAFEHPNRDPVSQARDAGSILVEGTRCSPEGGRPFLDIVMDILTAWRLRDPAGFAASGALQELAARYPDRADDFERVGRGIATDPLHALRQDPDLVEQLVALMSDPSGQLFMTRLPAIARMPGLPPGLDTTYIGDDAKRLERLHEELKQAPADGRPGALALQAEITARLARLGAAPIDRVRTATARARESVRRGPVPTAVTTMLLERLAQIWCPDNVVSDPVLDLGLAVELAEEAVAVDGGDARARRDLLVTLARCLRYRAGERRGPDLDRARALYDRALEQDRRSGNGDAIANTLHMLADLHHFVGDGSQQQRLRHVTRLEREAVELSSKGEMRARYQGNLAWTLARLGAQEADSEQATALFEESESLFRACLDVVTDEAHRANVMQNRETARSMRAQHRGDTADAIRVSRKRLAALGPDPHPEVLSKAKHNLADALTSSARPEDIREALELARQALEYRTPSRDPRQHWESAVAVGEMLLRLARHGARLSRAEREEAAKAFRSAAATARDLGAGTELHRAAAGLIELGLVVFSGKDADDTAEEGWQFMQQAMPYLLLDDWSVDAEGRAAKAMCFALADHEAQAGMVGALPGGVALSGQASERVLRWWLRADGAWKRRQRAMLEMPPGLPADQVLQWRRTLASGDQAAVVRSLRQLHEQLPGWLTEDNDLEETRRWLRRNEALAIGVWPGEQGFLVALVGARAKDDRVMLLAAPMLPYAEAQLADALRDAEQRAKILHLVVGWAHEVLVQRLQQAIGKPPKQVLWSPHGVLRLVPPSKLFGSIPTSVTASLALPARSTSRPRSQRAVVVVAEPSEAPMGTTAIEQAAALAEGAGQGRFLAARGARFGPDVHPTAVAAPADAEHVLEELDHAGLAIIMAHGHMAGPRDAWLHLLRTDGTEDRLDVQRLGAAPGALAGLRIVLLSCESGRTGDQAHMPGGVAGALLVAGAKEVVAPLWPVSVPNALRLGQALISGLTEGKPLAQVLSRFEGQAGTSGPQLGRVSKERRAAAQWDFAAFVNWVG